MLYRMNVELRERSGVSFLLTTLHAMLAGSGVCREPLVSITHPTIGAQIIRVHHYTWIYVNSGDLDPGHLCSKCFTHGAIFPALAQVCGSLEFAYVDQTGLELAEISYFSLPSKCWDHRDSPPFLAY